MKEVKKVWGKEVWVVNCAEYCGKILCITRGAKSSLHKHVKKKETFYCIKGRVLLTINEKEYILNRFSEPRTIKPNTTHLFKGITDAVMIEFSTHHEDSDVIRYKESEIGMG